MPVPTSDHLALAASMTSSGFADGLGRRALGFDREEGTMLERLTLRPELAAFETLLRERVERLATLEDERLARPGWIEHDSDGALVVVSEFVPGSRLSDILDITAEQGIAPGLDAAFGYLLDVLPALCGLHAGAGFAHGTIAPSRTVLTPAGQVVLLDSIYGGALSLLRYSRRKLWTDFGIAVPEAAGSPRLDVDADVAQVVLASVMLTLGRPLYEDEFPDALHRVVGEAAEVAQIRGGPQFAREYQAFLQRALPLAQRRAYASADDALIDLRTLASQLGVDVCRRALVDFIEQMEPTAGQQPATPDHDDVLDSIATYGGIGSSGPIELEFVVDDDEEDEDVADGDEAEISLEDLVKEPSHEIAAASGREISREEPSQEQQSDAAAGVNEELAAPSSGMTDGASAQSSDEAASASVRSKRAKRTRSARARKDKLRSAATSTPLATQTNAKLTAPDKDIARLKRDDRGNDVPESVEKAETSDKAGRIKKVEDVEPSRESDEKHGLEPVVRPEKRKDENWLVPPGRAEKFEPPLSHEPSAVPWVAQPIVPVPAPVVTPDVAAIPFTQVPTPGLPSAPPISLAPPTSPRVLVPGFGAPAAWSPPAPAAVPPPVQQQPLQAPPLPQLAPVRLKEPAPRPRVHRPSAAEEIYGSPLPALTNEQKTAFPWKLVAAALVGVAVLILGGRYLMVKDAPAAVEEMETAAVQSRTSIPTRRSTSTSSASPKNAAVPAAAPATGRLEIETQPAGAQILLDAKAVGVSPLTLDSVPVGRHSVTLTSAAGSVKRIVRIEGGRTLKLDVPIFSGWAGIFAPFVVVVSEGDRILGTTEEPRLMLSPGRHVLTLTNRELGYKSVETVEIEPGEVRTLSLDPRGTVNLNASPWAEVWFEGKKLGDTPLAGLQLPLGTQEVTFRHPQYGERKVTITVRGNQPAALSVKMTR